jgi:hypothetical protein
VSAGAIVHGPGVVEDALMRCALTRAEFAPWSAVVRNGQSLHLPLAANHSGAAARLCTADTDAYKSWLGVPDEAVRGGQLDGVSIDAARPLHPADFFAGDSLEGEARAELARVAWVYLFGDSSSVRDYKPAIDRHFGPFAAAVLLVRRIEVQAGARLIISGCPTVLGCDLLIIHDGGQLAVQTVSQVAVGELVRRRGRRQDA